MNIFKKTYLIGLTLLFGSCLYAQNQTFEDMLQELLSHTVYEIRTSEVESMLNKGALILDTRAFDEYQVSHILNAKWVGYKEFDENKVNELPNDKPIIVYCSVGYRSEKIAEKLQEMGFKKVYNYYGGIFSWKNDGNEVVTVGDKPTDKVHTYNRKWSQWLLKGQKVW